MYLIIKRLLSMSKARNVQQRDDRSLLSMANNLMNPAVSTSSIILFYSIIRGLYFSILSNKGGDKILFHG